MSERWICSRCYTSSPHDLDVCPTCGQARDAAQAVPTASESAVESADAVAPPPPPPAADSAAPPAPLAQDGRWVCNRCFASNPAAATACERCGLGRGEQPPTPAQATGPFAAPGPLAAPVPADDRRRRIPWVPIAIGVLAIGSVAYGLITAAQRDDSGQITSSGSIHWTELVAGDCFDFGEGEEVNEVAAVPCADPHTYEVFLVDTLPGGDYPPVGEVDAFAEERCTPAFETYVGHDYATSVWFASYVGPTEQAWGEGEQTVVCHLSNSTETAVTGSARGSER